MTNENDVSSGILSTKRYTSYVKLEPLIKMSWIPHSSTPQSVCDLISLIIHDGTKIRDYIQKKPSICDLHTILMQAERAVLLIIVSHNSSQQAICTINPMAI